MKSFSIDLDAIKHVAYKEGMAILAAKLTVVEDVELSIEPTLGFGVSQMHMSETTMRRLHEAFGKVLQTIDAHPVGLEITTIPSEFGTPKASA